jgi:hypothetical protein
LALDGHECLNVQCVDLKMLCELQVQMKCGDNDNDGDDDDDDDDD